jgi:aerobic-type carbon monoxide dehydrogenase small subunit (CoxS/CutS family)
MKTVNFILNGNQIECEVRDNETLLLMLRERLSVTSVKEGCSIGECGVCTVLVDDEPHYACLTLASKVEGRDVKTVEFLGNNDLLHPLQQSFISQGAVQCGYCTPGMLLVAYSLLLKNPKATEEEIRIAISGNLCRCTGYIQIIEAVKDAAAVTAGSREEPTADRVRLNRPK